MRVRNLLILTAIVSSVLGAVVVYLVLTVPNDLAAGSLLKGARKDLELGNTDSARDSLSRIVQQYPRTDAAAAATVALVRIADGDRAKVRREVEALRRDQKHLSATVAALQESVESLKSAPPRTVVVEKPAPKPPAVKNAQAKKAKTTHRRRRR